MIENSTIGLPQNAMGTPAYMFSIAHVQGLASQLRTLDAESLIDSLPIDEATRVVTEWRNARDKMAIKPPNNRTINQYRDNVLMLEQKYARHQDIEIGDMSPVNTIKQLFAHSRTISSDTWKVYRSAFLHVYNERAKEFEAKAAPQETLTRAIAALVIVSATPYDRRRTNTFRRSKLKSIRASDFERIITHLATAYTDRNVTARRAQSFAMATIATGLRPSEWFGSTLRAARADEIPHGETPGGWLALEVDTLKRKAGEPDWPRTVIVPPGPYAAHVAEHHHSLHSTVENKSAAKDPVKQYVNRCTLAIARACQEIWPNGNGPVTARLYTFRHQARANVAASYGTYIAAALMGHTPHTGQRCYAGKHRANMRRQVMRSGIPVPVPGNDVLMKAEEFRNNPALLEQLEAPRDDDEMERES